MLILALDTTSEVGGVGIFRDSECLASVANEGTADAYSVTLFAMAERALAQAHLELPDIEVYAAANGPGSFTGIRVGLSAARAWGKVFSRPVHGVSVLEAMVNKAPLTSDWAFPFLDARRGEFFAGAFRHRPAGPSGAGPQSYEPADAGWIFKPEALRAFVQEGLTGGASGTVLVRAHDQQAMELRARLPANLGWGVIEGPLLDAIAGVARRDEQAGQPCLAAKLDAYYIRRPDAEIKWKG